MPVYEAAKQCLEAFRIKDELAMNNEIQAFIRHHSNVRVYQQHVDAWQLAKETLKSQRAAFVAAGLERYDRGLLLEAEAQMWQWSPLRLRLLEKPVPGFLTLPCKHNEEEFQDILTWIRAQCSLQDIRTSPPPFVRALKLFSRRENGVDAPMICPRVGVSHNFMLARMAQVKFAMRDLPTLGLFLFPSMDTTAPDFEDFLEVTATGNNFEALHAKAASWMRLCFWRACNDMLSMDKEDDLRCLWLDASQERRDRALEAFRSVMLLREGVDLEYALACLDLSTECKVIPTDVVQAMKDVQTVSMKFCMEKLRPWSGEPSQPTRLDNLEGLDLGEFGASQILCTMDALVRIGNLVEDISKAAGVQDAECVRADRSGDCAMTANVAEVVTAEDYKPQESSMGEREVDTERTTDLGPWHRVDRL
jgi:hypothetical protein